MFGFLLCDSKNTNDTTVLTRLWSHEILRVFYDRLTNDDDRNWLIG